MYGTLHEFIIPLKITGGVSIENYFIKNDPALMNRARPMLELLANAREPPAAAPAVVAAVDAHPAPAAPKVERGVAPVAFGVFPVSAVGHLVGEGGIGFIHDGDGDWVSGLEATQLELLFEIVIF